MKTVTEDETILFSRKLLFKPRRKAPAEDLSDVVTRIDQLSRGMDSADQLDIGMVRLIADDLSLLRRSTCKKYMHGNLCGAGPVKNGPIFAASGLRNQPIGSLERRFVQRSFAAKGSRTAELLGGQHY